MNLRALRRIAAMVAMATVSVPALAHPGHDHSHATHSLMEIPAGVSGLALPILALVGAFGLALLAHAWADRSKSR
ncbi:MAG: hypothetical protein R3C13_10585 [Hyphomonas sp.]|uniref:hypothetical protein n=1 Tax=Hyphomonas sp. TaxID=87 RepID=UPI003529AFA5